MKRILKLAIAVALLAAIGAAPYGQTEVASHSMHGWYLQADGSRVVFAEEERTYR
jgi:hypothetical protein